MSSHNTTHLDAPLHFVEGGQDMAAFLNQDHPVERPCLARLLHLAAQADDASCCTRGGVCYREHIGQEDLPSAAALKDYEALLIFSGFGSIMAGVPACAGGGSRPGARSSTQRCSHPHREGESGAEEVEDEEDFIIHQIFNSLAFKNFQQLYMCV